TAPERQCFMRGGQFAIVQSATASSPCAQFARRIMRCDATFGARRSDDGRERSRRKEKCLHAVDYSVEGRPTDKVKACATIDSRGRRSCWALTLRCGEKSSHQKTGLDVGIVKSAVADPADVLAGYVSKMWSQARNSFALDGLDGTWNFRFAKRTTTMVDRFLREVQRMHQLRQDINEMTPEEADELIRGLGDDAAEDWIFAARDAQLPPPDLSWCWLFLGGRGAGKSHSMSAAVHTAVRAGIKRIHFIAPTTTDFHDVNVEGKSGIFATCGRDPRPRWVSSRRR